MEVVPTYQVFVMIAWVLLGLIIFGEYQLYSGAKLAGIGAGLVVCLLGVKFYTIKVKKKYEERLNIRRETTNESEGKRLGTEESR